jgi:hypothetical protein
MAFIGTPLDTRNTFQSLAGKRFNGDGSTTAFTLDVAPSSTLDIEVFVGNVRQDPNSAYTLNGTTLTFTGAPPSGTNNIYVVHQAKAVGTIEIPATTGSEKTFTGGVVIADDSDGSNGLKIGTGDDFKIYHDGTHTYMDNNTGALFMRNNGSVIIEDLSGNNIIRGIDGAAVDLYHNGTSVLNTTATGATVTTLGVINEKDLGAGIHIKTADSGATANADADEFVIENGTSGAGVGISLLSATNGEGRIVFGDSGDDNIGQIFYNHGDNSMRFHTAGAERMHLHNTGILAIGTATVQGSPNTSCLELKGTEAPLSIINETASDSGDRTSIALRNSSGTLVGNVGVDNSSAQFNTSSDYRLKENEVSISDGITRIKQLKPYKFNFKSTADKTVDGFFAHEVTPVVPEAITGTKDATKTLQKVVLDSSGNIVAVDVEQSKWTQGKTDGKYANDTTWEASKEIIKPQSIDQSKLVPLLTAALKEAITEIESLKARVTTLEG